MITPSLLRNGLLAATLLFATPVAFAQTTTKMKAKPGKGTVVKQKTEDGEKLKVKSGGQQTVMADPGQGVMVGGAMMKPARDIVDNANLSKDHTTLMAAVKHADLVETLKGAGPYTVFAPTNAAFAKLPMGTVDKLLLPENKEKLQSVLTYHVVAGALRAADLKDGQLLTTVQGQTLKVTKDASRVQLTDGAGITVNVTTPDVISSNGVTHVIDGVLMTGK